MEFNSDFQIPLRNRFECLDAREMDTPTNEFSRQDFIGSSIDEKLIHMFDELRFIRTEQVSCSTNIVKFQKTLSQVNEKVGQVVNVTNSQTELTRALAYKSIDLEARSRRNNLILRGIVENRQENCFTLVRDFLESKLDMDASAIYINRAHRLGGRIQGRNFNKRPIIVNFRDYGDVEYIMERVFMLKNSPGFSIDRDFPKEIQTARSQLWPKYKEYRSQNPRSKVSIRYPAKVIADGKVIYDELPQWNHYVNFNRLTHIEHIKNHYTCPSTGSENHMTGPNIQMLGNNTQLGNVQMNNNISTTSVNGTGPPPGYATARLRQQNTFTNMLHDLGENTGIYMSNQPCITPTNTFDNRNQVMSPVQSTVYTKDCTVIPDCRQNSSLNTNIHAQSVSQNNCTDVKEIPVDETLNLIRDANSTLEHATLNNSVCQDQQIRASPISIENTHLKEPHSEHTLPKTIEGSNSNRATHVSRARDRTSRRNYSYSPYRRSVSRSRNRISPSSKNSKRSSDKGQSARTLPTRGQEAKI